MSTRKSVTHKFFIIAVLTGVLLVFTLATNPDTIALPLLLIPFILLGVIFYNAVYAVLFIIKRNAPINPRNIFALSIASLGVLLLLLQSLNQLTWKDGMLALVFGIVFWLYVWRADFLRK